MLHNGESEPTTRFDLCKWSRRTIPAEAYLPPVTIMTFPDRSGRSLIGSKVFDGPAPIVGQDRCQWMDKLVLVVIWSSDKTTRDSCGCACHQSDWLIPYMSMTTID